jgi:hypothetical protein
VASLASSSRDGREKKTVQLDRDALAPTTERKREEKTEKMGKTMLDTWTTYSLS